MHYDRTTPIVITPADFDEIEAGKCGSVVFRGSPHTGGATSNYAIVDGNALPWDANRVLSVEVGATLYISFGDLLDLWEGLGYDTRHAASARRSRA